MDNNQMHILDITNDKPKVKTLWNANISSEDSYFIFAENNLHLIAGRSVDTHLIYNADSYKFGKHRVCNDWQRNYYGGLIYVKSKQKMLLFGGWTDQLCTDSIWQYSFQNEEWTLLDYKLPFKGQIFGSVLSVDERCIIILVGWTQPSLSLSN